MISREVILEMMELMEAVSVKGTVQDRLAVISENVENPEDFYALLSMMKVVLFPKTALFPTSVLQMDKGFIKYLMENKTSEYLLNTYSLKDLAHMYDVLIGAPASLGATKEELISRMKAY